MQKSNIELDAFSIDIVEKQVIEDLLDAFDIQARNIYSCPFQAGVEEEQYVEWHMKLLDEGKVNVALTSLRCIRYCRKRDTMQFICLRPGQK